MKRIILAVVALCMMAGPVMAAGNLPSADAWELPSNVQFSTAGTLLGGQVPYCQYGGNSFVPCSPSAPLPVTIQSGGGGSAAPYQYTPLVGSQHALVITTATSLTVPSGAKYASVIAVGGAVNYDPTANLSGGSAPTSAVGTPLAAGSQLFIQGSLSAYEFIDATGSTAKLDVTYYY
jgi:hypothetical protein